MNAAGLTLRMLRSCHWGGRVRVTPARRGREVPAAGLGWRLAVAVDLLTVAGDLDARSLTTQEEDKSLGEKKNEPFSFHNQWFVGNFYRGKPTFGFVPERKHLLG